MSIDPHFRKAAREGMAATISATMFLSRLPLSPIAERLRLDVAGIGFEHSARFFGLAAIIVALPAALTVWFAGYVGLPPVLSAIVAIIASVLTTGALHEDALADVVDGFGGGANTSDKLEIMRDSQIGSYGASGLILSFALHIACLSHLISIFGNASAGLIVLAANVASTTFMVWPWATLPPARAEGGLSASHGVPGRDAAISAMLIGLPIAFVLVWLSTGTIQALSGLALGWGAMMLFSALCQRQIGGHTGDTLGATKKISELILLLALIVAT